MTETKPRQSLPFLFLGLGLALILAALYSILVLQKNSSQTDFSVVPAQVNFAAPELTLADSQGVTHSLADYRGQVVLVNLWATWCPPCKEEMPALQSFYDKHINQGFTIVAVNDGEVDRARDTEIDDVIAGLAVGSGDRLAQADHCRIGVHRVGQCVDHESREYAAEFKLF